MPQIHSRGAIMKMSLQYELNIKRLPHKYMHITDHWTSGETSSNQILGWTSLKRYQKKNCACQRLFQFEKKLQTNIGNVIGIGFRKIGRRLNLYTEKSLKVFEKLMKKTFADEFEGLSARCSSEPVWQSLQPGARLVIILTKKDKDLKFW